jgi:hypothetical protein
MQLHMASFSLIMQTDEDLQDCKQGLSQKK